MKNATTIKDLLAKGLVEVSPGIFKRVEANVPLVKKAPLIIQDSELQTLKLVIMGEPMSKQSFLVGKGRGYTPAKQVYERNRIIPIISNQLPLNWKLWTQEVHITMMHFIFPLLKKHGKQVRIAIENGQRFYKTTTPDMPDNLKKLTLDAMSKLVYKDDALICTENDIAKYYGINPGTIIHLKGI